MEKNFVYIILTMMIFVGYVFIFDYIFRYIEMMFVPYGLLLFILQIGFSIVILFPASIITTRKIVEIVRG